ncbi:phosphoribosyltransferase domain-containing protein [Actinoallomurus sp. NBC_01490]|uniref:phosphoribosyltransferase family protein n=1 Tax=Actinoallomurus sp. NBC_01490 TaxID=2903557 RepID=UPI002E33B56E|nr:phosphoribosyltransferase family protein [Actinoallomurus sp. NBC_01490]
MFEHRRLWQLTPAAYHAGMKLLTEAARDRLGQIGTVIGIADGGRAPANAIAAIAGAPVVAVSARHNATDATFTQATGRVHCDTASFQPLINQPGPFLVVDDICGTGATLTAVTDTLTHLVALQAAICTATLCRNLGASPGTPDLHLWDVADWVVFPWEPLTGTTRPTPLPIPTEVHSSS